MTKMSISEAAEHFKVSKEAIHNRIRRGSLDCVIENGVKFVAIEPQTRPNSQNNANHPPLDTRYYDYIEEENARLRSRVEKLEGENSTLRDQREAMLIAEREKIEQIYKERDAQLRDVLHVVASKFLSAHGMERVIDEVRGESREAEVIEAEPIDDLISLKKYLKRQGMEKKERTAMMARFAQRLRNDDRIFEIEGKLYIRPLSFDYSDLLS
ncbi:MAG: DNA-binding protein [Campylobacterales bacterium]|nr:DNA-binding protein [Campylobacterales bacterium]